MPSFIRQVDFDLTPAYSRPPGDDEVYVMKAFARHCSHCTTCAHPYEVHKRGGALCAKGHQRALDVAQYLFNIDGHAYSLVDREGNQRVQVEIPVGCEAVRELLKAMERGLRLRRRVPSVSYDPTYYVAPRKVQPERIYQHPKEVRSNRKPQLETAEPPMYSRQQPREKPRYIGRGSLFEEDMREKESRYKSQQPIYYMATPSIQPKARHWH